MMFKTFDDRNWYDSIENRAKTVTATSTSDVRRYKVMQFTGLHDANGSEIYSGDIISDHVGVGEVKYSEKHAAFRVVYGDGMAKWFHDYNLRGERESIEVIGNIYENKELLNAKTN